MAEDRLDRIERILENVARDHELFAKDHELFAKDHELFARDHELFDKEMHKLQIELHASQKETAERQKETDKQIKETSRELGGIGGGLGRAAEGLTAPSVPRVFKKLGITVEAVHQRVKALRDGQVASEIDILCPARRNGSSLILVGEVKAHLTNEDVKDFLDESLISFKENFTEYKDREVVAFVSGLNVEENASKFAQKKGLYVLIPFGETMRIANSADFEPKVW
ncbi:DUF3782 domain-containing protein [bacterium]|nr:DUF3782 domain-containing protein [bacterium]MBU1753401.1 DUF3782 domain-containing protein [bacterium]